MSSDDTIHSARERAIEAYRARYDAEPEFIASAPGRVNLIGEHTDYNDGFVLPMGLPFVTAIAAGTRDDRLVEVASEGYGVAHFDLDADPLESLGWGRYLHGMAHFLGETQDLHTAGFCGTLATDIPTGASLSTSAALEMATGLLLGAMADRDLDRTQLALLGQRVENELFDLPTGIMDQLASAAAIDGHASLIDCRDLSITPVPLPADTAIVVMDTGTRRELVESEYADRQATCRAVTERLGIPALRDADMDMVATLTDDDVAHRRARHVVGENQRTLDAAAAMRAGDSEWLGQLMSASHVSLSRDYEVSGPALDRIVEVAQGTPGCLGARMTGGGFAGCAVALVEAAAADAFVEAVTAEFIAPAAQPATHPTRLYVVQPSAGAAGERRS